jgi:acyl carrier protein
VTEREDQLETTELETTEQLTEFWMELLDVESVSPGDHLLDLGGNSLVATMIANRIEFAWGIRPTMEQLLTSSLQELAVLCEQARTG